MFVSWLSILSAITFTTALPVSVFPVRPYVFLTPELPKFTLQPSLKVQTPASVQSLQPVPLTKSDSSANGKQYMLVYPTYQYVTTRQDGSSSGGFIETIQSYFINLVSGQSDESSQIMDPVEPDKQQQQQQQQQQQPQPQQQQDEQSPDNQVKSSFKLADGSQENQNVNSMPNESKQKLVYSYLTPASTVPLNADRRLFYLAEQPQPIFGSFSGSALNPVFNLQPVPVVLSRSNNVAQPDDPQPNKVITENVQKFSQIPPVMAMIEQLSQVQGKSHVNEQSDSVVVDAVPENRLALQPLEHPVENNKALPVVSTEPTRISDVSAVVLARSNAVPLNVANESVSPVEAPVVANNVERSNSVQPAVISPSLEKVQAAPSDVLRSADVDQNVLGRQTAESVTGSVV